MTRHKNLLSVSRIFFAALLLLLPILAGCREVNGVVWSEFRDIPDSGWNPSMPLSFDPAPQDSTKAGGLFDLWLCVRYSARRPMPPVRVRALYEDESGVLADDTISIVTFGPEGDPMGRGRYGVCETMLPLRRGFPLTPGFGLDLFSLSSQADSDGFIDIGLILSRKGSVPEN